MGGFGFIESADAPKECAQTFVRNTCLVLCRKSSQRSLIMMDMMECLLFERAEIVYATYHSLESLLVAFHEALGEDGPSQKGIVEEVGKARNGDLAGGRILPSMML